VIEDKERMCAVRLRRSLFNKAARIVAGLVSIIYAMKGRARRLRTRILDDLSVAEFSKQLDWDDKCAAFPRARRTTHLTHQ
jgi:hexokinase